MLAYRSAKRGASHIIDESVVTYPPSRCATLCGRAVPEDRRHLITESERIPDCTICARELRRLQRETRLANAEPVKEAQLPMPSADDLLCPVCRKPMKLATRRLSLPTKGAGAIRVMLMMLCTNEPGHQENP